MTDDKIREAFEKVYVDLGANVYDRKEIDYLLFKVGVSIGMQSAHEEVDRLHQVIGSLESDVRDCEHQVECRDKMIDKLTRNRTEAVELVMKATKFIPKLGTAGWYQDAKNFIRSN